MQFSGSWQSAFLCARKNFTGKRVLSTFFLWKPLLLLIQIHIRKGVIWNWWLLKSKHILPETKLMVVLFSFHLIKWIHSQRSHWIGYKQVSEAVGNLIFRSFSNNCHIPECEKLLSTFDPIPEEQQRAVSHSRIMGWSNPESSVILSSAGFHSDRPRCDPTVADTRRARPLSC